MSSSADLPLSDITSPAEVFEDHVGFSRVHQPQSIRWTVLEFTEKENQTATFDVIHGSAIAWNPHTEQDDCISLYQRNDRSGLGLHAGSGIEGGIVVKSSTTYGLSPGQKGL